MPNSSPPPDVETAETLARGREFNAYLSSRTTRSTGACAQFSNPIAAAEPVAVDDSSDGTAGTLDVIAARSRPTAAVAGR